MEPKRTPPQPFSVDPDFDGHPTGPAHAAEALRRDSDSPPDSTERAKPLPKNGGAQSPSPGSGAEADTAPASQRSKRAGTGAGAAANTATDKTEPPRRARSKAPAGDNAAVPLRRARKDPQEPEGETTVRLPRAKSRRAIAEADTLPPRRARRPPPGGPPAAKGRLPRLLVVSVVAVAASVLFAWAVVYRLKPQAFDGDSAAGPGPADLQAPGAQAGEALDPADLPPAGPDDWDTTPLEPPVEHEAARVPAGASVEESAGPVEGAPVRPSGEALLPSSAADKPVPTRPVAAKKPPAPARRPTAARSRDRATESSAKPQPASRPSEPAANPQPPEKPEASGDIVPFARPRFHSEP